MDRQKTVAADAFDANPWGLHNVHGPTWEWTQDRWRDDFNGAQVTELRWEEGQDEPRRVVRGGSWCNSPRRLRSAERQGTARDYRWYSLGFRLARTL